MKTGVVKMKQNNYKKIRKSKRIQSDQECLPNSPGDYFLS